MLDFQLPFGSLPFCCSCEFWFGFCFLIPTTALSSVVPFPPLSHITTVVSPPCLILVIWPLFLVQLSLWHHIIGNSQMGARHPSPHAFEQVGTGSWVLQMRSSNKRLRNPSLQAKISHSDVCGSDIGQSRL